MREVVGQRAIVTSVLNPEFYGKSTSGVAMHVIIAKPTALGVNIVARGSNFSWSYNFEINPVEEYNTRFIQETVNGKMTLGSGTLATMLIMEINDKLPTYKDLSKDEELIIYHVSGEDEEVPNVVYQAFFGVKISGRSGSSGSTGLAMLNIPFVFRKHYTGSDYKLKNSASQYPAEVSA